MLPFIPHSFSLIRSPVLHTILYALSKSTKRANIFLFATDYLMRLVTLLYYPRLSGVLEILTDMIENASDFSSCQFSLLTTILSSSLPTQMVSAIGPGSVMSLFIYRRIYNGLLAFNWHLLFLPSHNE